MRGQDAQHAQMFSYLSPEQPVPANHPLRPLRAMVDKALLALSARFSELYSPIGRGNDLNMRAPMAHGLAGSPLQHRN